MKNHHYYILLTLIVVVLLAVISGCSQATTVNKTPGAPTSQGEVTAPVAPATGAPDLIITQVKSNGTTIDYTIKNMGAVDSPPTYTYLKVNDLMPTVGGSSYVDILKPGQEQVNTFSSYKLAPSGSAQTKLNINNEGYADVRLLNTKVQVCADAKGEVSEAVETNNCKVMVLGTPWNYDLLSVYNRATWVNGNGDIPEPGGEGNVVGAHFEVRNTGSIDVTPVLETIPQQVPDGFMQGTWGYFYTDESGSQKSAPIRIPSKLHFVANVGLATTATENDGVIFRFGLKDSVNTKLTWVDSKKMTVPGSFTDWDINLSNYEGQIDYFILRVDAGADPVNDFAIWKKASIMQVND